MDPIVTLELIRELARNILKKEDESDDALALAAHIQDLDSWILSGGFSPWGR